MGLKRKSPVPQCPACFEPLAASAEQCPFCGRETASDFPRELSARLMRELGEELGESPYLRGSDGLSYTLQGHTWGLLEDAKHPLGAAILWTLFRLSVASEPAELPFVLHQAIHRRLHPRFPTLARAVDHLRRRLAPQWDELCASQEARAFRGTRDTAGGPSFAPLSGESEAELWKWFERWRLSPAVSTRDGGSR